jgi:hypothetical protein
LADLERVEWSTAALSPVGSDSLVAPVAPTDDLADLAWSRQASLVEYLSVALCRADLAFRAEFLADSVDSVSSCLESPADSVVDWADSVFPVSLAVSKADLADSVVWFPVDFRVPMAADSAPVDFLDEAAGILLDDTSSCRDILVD